MVNEKKYPNWFLWLYEHFPIALMLAAAGLGVFAFGIYWVDHRLTDIEVQLNYAPPKRYSAPNLAEYSAGEVTVDALSKRRTVYVPVYSHVYYQGGSAYSLETTLSIRNIDIDQAIYVESVEYFDTDGALAKTHVDRLIKLNPLQTIEFLIERQDSSGGSGANFLVRWGAESDVNRPLIETVMVGTAGTQGISFGRTGIELDEE